MKLFLSLLLVFSSLSAETRADDFWKAEPSPKHEVRAVWLTTIGGIDWPRTRGYIAQKQELTQILDRLKAAGINTVLFQSRVRGTTDYPSKLEPWDTSLTDTPGKNPGYDPLQLCIDLCHERGMECHAWVVTIPLGKWNKIGCKTLRKKYPKLIKRVGEDGFMDPENPKTGDYLAMLCGEIVDAYDVDGIHLDYIRYPETWPARWKVRASLEQRRSYITDIVRKINRRIKSQKPWIKFSCSPVGKYGDLRRYSAGGWNAHTAVCQDAQLWLKEGLMDQLYPMMYFRDDNFFPFAIDWQENSYGRMVIPGLGIYFLDPREGKWTLDQITRQMNTCRQLGIGHCYFRTKFFTDNTKGIYDFGKTFDATPALVPPMTWQGAEVPLAPTRLSLKGNRLCWDEAKDRSNAPYLLYNIYASDTYPVDIMKAENLMAIRVMKNEILVPKTKRYYAVTAMNRYGLESEAIQMEGIAASRSQQTGMVKGVIVSNGNAVKLPPKGQTLDADFVAVETMQGQSVTIRPYTPMLRVDDIPDGYYQLRSLGKKGRNHRLGFLMVKRRQF